MDHQLEGFSWIDCQDYRQSVVSFIRRSSEGWIVVVVNLTPVPRFGYRIGVPYAPHYREEINSDSEWYGGSNLGTPVDSNRSCSFSFPCPIPCVDPASFSLPHSTAGKRLIQAL